ncbi:hypothetical protein LIER_41807 [Lithospermum erythrorhizon]|uniref:Uncharacterized protein n=1 Tax=Lithospermum erythrorhizon TaxID=34254 RepID=A0AAV3RKR2_LITER
MKSDDICKQYVRHWSSREQRAGSEINAKNRAARKGKSHDCVYKSVAARIHEKEKEGSLSPFLNVMVEINMKRDEKNNPTGEVHHEGFRRLLPETNTEEAELEFDLWTSTDEVSRRVPQRRVLGIG